MRVNPSGAIAILVGYAPTEMVCTVVLRAISMTDTLLSALFATTARSPSGVIAMASGTLPTAIV